MAAKTNASIAPVQVATFVVAPVGVSAVASHNTDTPTNTTLLVSGAADGTRLTKLKGAPRATSVAGRALLFRSKDGGTTKKFVASRAVTLYTFSTTTDPTAAQLVDFQLSETSPIFLENANDQLYIGFTVAQTADGWTFEAEGGKYGTA